MQYRQLGKSGVKVSALSLGAWITFAGQMDRDTAAETMSVAFNAGINYFDNAEEYGNGVSESVMGNALRDLCWPRHSYMVSTKFYWGIHDSPNTKNTLNRKYLMEAIDPSLERLGLDHVDVVYCHRFDPTTPLEEIVWAMSDLVTRGKTHYWGTSKWPVTAIEQALAIGDRHHLHKPVVEQPEYSLTRRRRVEIEYAALRKGYGLGLTTHSPLEKGLLTGKYLDGVTAGTRASLVPRLSGELNDRSVNQKVGEFAKAAESMGCSSAQLALAWAMSSPSVDSVICGASSPSQMAENVAASDLLDAMDGETRTRLQDLFAGANDLV